VPFNMQLQITIQRTSATVEKMTGVIKNASSNPKRNTHFYESASRTIVPRL